MKVHKFKNDPQTLLEQGKEIIARSGETKFIYRVTLASLILGGMSPKDLSRYCSETERTLQLWVKKADECGWESLFAVRQSGRPGVLTKEQKDEIRKAVCRPPQEYGYSVWDGPTLSDYIRTRYEIDYGVRACQKLLCRMRQEQNP